MQLAAPTEDEAIVALEQLKKTVRIAFCGVMQSTPAAADGRVDARGDGGRLALSRGRRRASGRQALFLRLGAAQAADVEALQTSLALSADGPRADIHAMEVAGSA